MDNNGQKKPKRNVLTIIFFVLCFIGSAVAGAMFASSDLFDLEGTAKKLTGRDADEELIKAKDKATVLIMGVDIRKDDVGRSDTLMIATVDPRLDQATLLSIPRDTRVKIRGRGYDKINAAFAYGGVSLTESTVENFLGIDIDHYVLINTRSFVKIIDAIGGVDIDVEKRMFYEDPWDDDGGLVIDLYPGEQHMDGKTAVTYVRYRDSEGDIGRVKRQQAFMKACMDKVTSPSIVPRIPKIVREVIDAVETDMSLRQLLELAGALKAAQQNGLETDMVPGYPLYIDDISYWIPDVEELRISVADALGIAVDPYLRERFERAAREYNDSIPDGARDVPEGEDYIGNPVRESREHRRSLEERSYARTYEDDYRRSSSRDSRSYEDRSSSRDSRSYEDRSSSRDSRSYEDVRADSRESRSYDEPRADSRDSRSYDEPRADSRDSRSYDDTRTSSRDSRSYDDDRADSRNSRSYDDTRTSSRDSRSYDEPRADSRDSRSYDEPRADSRDSRSYDDSRAGSNDIHMLDDDRLTSSDRRSTYEEPRIERRTIPEADESFEEPSRYDAPKTRY